MAEGKFSLLISDEDELIGEKIPDLCSFLTALPQEVQVVAPLLQSAERHVVCGGCHRDVTATDHRRGCLEGPLPGYWVTGVLPIVYGYISGWIYRTNPASLDDFPVFPSAFEGNPYAYDVYRIHRLNQGEACQARIPFPVVKQNRESIFQSQLNENVYGISGRTLQYANNKKILRDLRSVSKSLKVSAELRILLICSKQLFAGGNLITSTPGAQTNRETCARILNDPQLGSGIGVIERWILLNICAGKYRQSLRRLIDFAEKVLAFLTMYHLIRYKKLLNQHDGNS